MAALLAVLLGGCVVSPQPSPPVIVLDGDLIASSPDPMILRTTTTVVGGAGAVDPPEGVIVATNLDTTAPPVVAEVNADGSFQVEVEATTTQVVRLQAKQEGYRSQPVDVLLAEDPASGTTPPELTCLGLEPGAWVSLDLGAAADVVVRNTCAEEVAFDAPRLRRGSSPFTVSVTAPFVVPAGGSTVITVRADGDGEEREDVLLLGFTAPVIGRRALTLTIPD
ncbi:hypothetical protein [Sorangium sp. So ce131]|uniref:hypothetical protein n=1 Tax=Sorangium sp. So ce131 TaxID=3133282 RepID=UPI003F61666D